MNQAIKEQIEEIKKDTKPTDASPLFKLLMSKKISKEEKEKMILSVCESMNKIGEKMLYRAFTEGILTEKEYKDLDISPESFCAVLQGYFNKKDGYFSEKERVVIMTVEDSEIFKHREFLQDRFNVAIKSAKEIATKLENDKS